MRKLTMWSAVVALGLSGYCGAQAGQLPNLLTINPAVTEFNPTGVGSTSYSYYGPSIYNPGPSSVTITEIKISGPHASDFSLNPNSCPPLPYSLPANEYCYLSVTFAPAATGLRTASLVVKDTGGATQTAVLVGQGLAATQVVSFSVPQLTFASAGVGTPVQSAPTAYVSVANTGTAPLNIDTVTLGGPNPGDFTITSNYCVYGPVLPQGSCYLYLAFVPTATGVRSADLVLVDNGPGGAQSLPLTGIATPPLTAVEFFPAAVAFAPAGSANNEDVQVTIQNTGSEPVTISNFQITGQNASDFSIAQSYCEGLPYTLQAQYACSVEVQFTPSAVGVRLANLEIFDNAPGSPQVVPLEGNGEAPTVTLAFNPAVLAFGATDLGAYSSEYLYLENLGTESATVTYEIQGANAADFSTQPYCFTINPNSSCFVPVSFAPSAAGIRQATLKATDSVSNQSTSLTLMGGGTPSGNPLTSSPPVFNPVAVGESVSGFFYIYNEGSAPVTITEFTVSGAAKSDFAIQQNNCSGLPVYQYDACSIQLAFTPSAPGTRIAQMNIGYSGGNTQVNVPLLGTGLAPARTIGFSTSELDFQPTPVGVPSSSGVNVTNTGTESVKITDVSLTGNNAQDYAITMNQCPQGPATLASGATCQVLIQFTPSALGARLARLQVSDNASGSPQSLSLVGFGTNAAPLLNFQPTLLTFESQALGSSQEQGLSVQTVYGSSPVTLNSLKIVGPNASDFSMTNDCTSPLTQCDVYVTFTPSASGVRVGELQFTDNANGSPQIVPLSGFGALPVTPVASVSFSPIPLAFSAAQAVGYTATATFSITNTGTENVLFTKFHIGGKSASDFGIQSNGCPLSPAPLTPNASCPVSISFTPRATGTRMATISVTDNASGSPQSMGLIGEAVAAVKTLEANPTSVTFEQTTVGSTDYEGASVNLTNTGTAPITFQSYSIGGADGGDFSIGVNLCTLSSPTLNPGYSCEILLNFTPSATGTRTGELSVTSDASNSPVKVSLSGVGQ